MKQVLKSFIAILICLVIAGQANAEKVIVRGTLDNPFSQSIAIKFTSNKPDHIQAFVTTEMHEDNTFYTDFEIYESVEAYLYNGRDFITHFTVNPGEELSIYADLNNISGTLSFDGLGAAKNNFWKEFRSFNPDYFEKTYYYRPFSFYTSKETLNNYHSSTDVADFIIKTDASLSTNIEFLNSFNERDPIDTESYAKIYEGLESRWLNARIMYYYLQQTLMRPDNKEIPLDFHQYIERTNKQNMEQLLNKEYVNATMTYLGYLNFLNQFTGPRETSQDYYQLINENYVGLLKYYLQTRLFLRDLSNKDIGLWEQKKPEFQDYNPIEEWNLMIDGAYHEILSTYSQMDNKAFTLPDENGQMISSANYVGKVVYVSFWASWCKPCLENFEKYKSKKAELEQEGVVFINISLDRKCETTRNNIEKYGIEGINLIACDNLDEISKQFNVKALPSYIVIDKNGNLAPLSGDLETVEKDLRLLVQN